MLHTGLWIQTMDAFKNGFSSMSSHPPRSHSGPSLTAIVSGTIKSRKKITLALIMGSATGLTHTPHRSTHKCTTHTRRIDVTIDFWADVRDVAQIQSPSHKWCFLSFKSHNRSATPGQWLALYLGCRSIQTQRLHHSNLQFNLSYLHLQDFL